MLSYMNLGVARFTNQLFDSPPAFLTYQYATLVIVIPTFSGYYIGFRLNITNDEAGIA